MFTWTSLFTLMWSNYKNLFRKDSEKFSKFNLCSHTRRHWAYQLSTSPVLPQAEHLSGPHPNQMLLISLHFANPIALRNLLVIICNEYISSEIKHSFNIYYPFTLFDNTFPIYFSFLLDYFFYSIQKKSLCSMCVVLFLLVDVEDIFFQIAMYGLVSFMNLSFIVISLNITKSSNPVLYNFCTLSPA